MLSKSVKITRSLLKEARLISSSVGQTHKYERYHAGAAGAGLGLLINLAELVVHFTDLTFEGSFHGFFLYSYRSETCLVSNASVAG